MCPEGQKSDDEQQQSAEEECSPGEEKGIK